MNVCILACLCMCVCVWVGVGDVPSNLLTFQLISSEQGCKLLAKIKWGGGKGLFVFYFEVMCRRVALITTGDPALAFCSLEWAYLKDYEAIGLRFFTKISFRVKYHEGNLTDGAVN